MHPLFIIFGFILIVACIGLGAGLVFHKRDIEYKERKNALDRANGSGGSIEQAETIAKLEDRVRVLERLATDRGHLLADEIEQLRELPSSEASKENA